MRLGDLDALKKAIKSYADDQYAENEYLGEYTIMKIIDNAPTVAEDYATGYQDGLEDGLTDIRPQGEWKAEMIGYSGKTIRSITYKCSECGRRIVYVPNSIDTDETVFLSKYPFCHCGASMNKGGAK